MTIVSSLEVTFEVRAHLHGPFSPQAEAQQDTCRRHPAEPSVNSKAPTPIKHHRPPPHPSTTPQLLVNKKDRGAWLGKTKSRETMGELNLTDYRRCTSVICVGSVWMLHL